MTAFINALLIGCLLLTAVLLMLSVYRLAEGCAI